VWLEDGLNVRYGWLFARRTASVRNRRIFLLAAYPGEGRFT
jgi:hypothetical protein